jgi:hypothetical protein
LFPLLQLIVNTSLSQSLSSRFSSFYRVSYADQLQWVMHFSSHRFLSNSSLDPFNRRHSFPLLSLMIWCGRRYLYCFLRGVFIAFSKQSSTLNEFVGKTSSS